MKTQNEFLCERKIWDTENGNLTVRVLRKNRHDREACPAAGRGFFEGKTIMGKQLKIKSNRFALNYFATKFSPTVTPIIHLTSIHKKDRLSARETLSAFSVVICTFRDRSETRMLREPCFYCLKSLRPRCGAGMAFVLRRKVSSIKSLILAAPLCQCN